MKLLRLKKSNVYLLDGFPQSVKNGVLTYFIMGQGYKKTKAFEYVEGVEMPERWSKVINWLFVAKVFDQYGIEVAERYADCLTAGIVARQSARGYGLIYQKIKHLIDGNFNPEFFALMRCDYMLSCYGLFMLDIVGMDTAMGKIDPDYIPEQSKYKGRECSMKEYVTIKYGEQYARIIEAANSSETDNELKQAA